MFDWIIRQFRKRRQTLEEKRRDEEAAIAAENRLRRRVNQLRAERARHAAEMERIRTQLD